MTIKVTLFYKRKIHADRLAQNLWPGSPHDQCAFKSATLQGTLQGEICMSRFSRHRSTTEYLWSDVLQQGLTQELHCQHPFWGTSSCCWLLFMTTYVHLQSSLTQPCTLCNCKIIGTFDLVPNKCTNVWTFCSSSSAVTCAWSLVYSDICQ